MLPLEFYLRNNVLTIARDLIGTHLFTQIENEPVTGGMIIETEAYAGVEDRASHAFNGRRTKRNEVMYWKGGAVYVYLCYGIHPLLNVVTNESGIPHAVLVRAIRPTKGVEIIRERRKGKLPLAAGPGMVSQALGITIRENGQSFLSSSIWIEARNSLFDDNSIKTGPRIGVDYAKEHALLPWRFYV